MTRIRGLHDDAQLIPLIGAARGLREAIGGASVSASGTGGIATKLGAAEEAAAAGIPTIIASGMQSGVLEKVFDAKQQMGTLILPEEKHLRRKKHWIGFNLKPVGTIVVNEGAYQAVVRQGQEPAACRRGENRWIIRRRRLRPRRLSGQRVRPRPGQLRQIWS